MAKRRLSTKNKSQLHKETYALFRQAFPGFPLQEEVSLDINADGVKTTVFVDIFVPALNLCVECHGRQHFEFVPHFHGSRGSYEKAIVRDTEKERVLRDSGYAFLVVRYDDKLTVNKLIRRIKAIMQE